MDTLPPLPAAAVMVLERLWYQSGYGRWILSHLCQQLEPDPRGEVAGRFDPRGKIGQAREDNMHDGSGEAAGWWLIRGAHQAG